MYRLPYNVNSIIPPSTVLTGRASNSLNSPFCLLGACSWESKCCWGTTLQHAVWFHLNLWQYISSKFQGSQAILSYFSVNLLSHHPQEPSHIFFSPQTLLTHPQLTISFCFSWKEKIKNHYFILLPSNWITYLRRHCHILPCGCACGFVFC